MRTISSAQVGQRRIPKLLNALVTSESFKDFMSTRSQSISLEAQEAELLYMLMDEAYEHPCKDTPRRTVLKKLHSTYTRVRAKREWADLEKLL